MRPNFDLEPGAVYEGSFGQVREVIEFDPEETTLRYRMIHLGTQPRSHVPREGETDKIQVHVFVDWIKREVA